MACMCGMAAVCRRLCRGLCSFLELLPAIASGKSRPCSHEHCYGPLLPAKPLVVALLLLYVCWVLHVGWVGVGLPDKLKPLAQVHLLSSGLPSAGYLELAAQAQQISAPRGLSNFMPVEKWSMLIELVRLAGFNAALDQSIASSALDQSIGLVLVCLCMLSTDVCWCCFFVSTGAVSARCCWQSVM